MGESSIGSREGVKNVLYWAKRSFMYGVRGSTERQLDRGQVFKLEGLINDKLLVDLAYVSEVPEGTTTYACRGCGGEFVDMGMRDGHGDLRHRTKTFTPPPPPVRRDDETSEMYQNRLDAWAADAGRQADAAMEELDRKEDSLAPIDLTKSSASRA